MSKSQFDARVTRHPQEFQDWGGEHRAIYKGKCVVCNRNVYSEQDKHGEMWGDEYDPDWRGIIGANSVDSLIAEEYGKIGEDVKLCAVCGNTRELYHRGLQIAYAQWQETEMEAE